jgi:hypothetical protein
MTTKQLRALLINTPLQRGVRAWADGKNRFNGFCVCDVAVPRLKPDVNENWNCARSRWYGFNRLMDTLMPTLSLTPCFSGVLAMARRAAHERRFSLTPRFSEMLVTACRVTHKHRLSLTPRFSGVLVTACRATHEHRVSLTPRFSEVLATEGDRKTVSTVFRVAEAQRK